MERNQDISNWMNKGNSFPDPLNVDPDKHAQNMGLAKTSGLPFATVSRKPEEVQKQVHAKDVSKKLEANPDLTAFLNKDPDNYKLAHDDVDNLTQVIDVLRSVPGGGVQGAGMSLSGLGELNDAATRMIDRGLDAVLPDSVMEKLRAPIPWYLNPSEIVKRPGEVLKELADNEILPPAERRNVVTDIAQGVGQVSSQIAMTLAFGAGSSGVMMAGQGADIQAEKIKEAKAETSTGTDLAIFAGAGVTALTEKLGIDAILNRVPPSIKNKVLKQVVDLSIAGGVEAVQEVVEGIAQNLVEIAFYNPDAEIVDWAQAEQEAKAAGGTGVIVRAIVNAATKGRQAHVEQRNKQGVEFKVKRLQELANGAKLSKFRERAPERFKELITHAQNAESENVYLPAEAFTTFFQDKPEEGMALLEQAGVSAQYEEAQSTGADLVIPLENWVMSFGISDYHVDLTGNIRFEPDGKNLNELNAEDEQSVNLPTDLLNEPEISEADQSAQSVFDDVKDKLVAAGHAEKTAEREAALYRSFYRTQAQEMGVDPFTLYQRRALQLRGPFSQNNEQIKQSLNSKAEDNGLAITDIPTKTGERESTLTDSKGNPGENSRPVGDDLTKREAQSQNIDPDSPTLHQEYEQSSAPFKRFEIGIAEKLFSQSFDKVMRGESRNVLNMGEAPPVLREFGFDKLDIAVPQSVIKKALGQKKAGTSDGKHAEHVEPSAVSDLVQAIADPVAVFESAQHSDRAVVITRLKDRSGNYIAVVVAPQGKFSHHKTHAVPSIHPRTNAKGLGALKYVENKKSLQSLQKALRNMQGTVIHGGLPKNIPTKADLINKHGSLFYQEKGGDNRGAISFNPNSGQAVISLFEKADLSTFLHESGHLFLEETRSFAAMNEASAQQKQDWQTLKSWLGVEGEALSRDQHEQFARGFEAYLMEGKAPSLELQSVFNRMRAWLVNIYRSVKGLNVELNDDVRSVMDRMLATQDEIKNAQEANRYMPLFEDAQSAGLNEEEYQAYVGAAEAATQAAENELLHKTMNEVTREQKAWWNDERARIRSGVEETVSNKPVYQALDYLKSGLDGKPVGLDRNVLVEFWGEDILKQLPGSVPPIYRKEGGAHPEMIADMFGFSSADELIKAMVAAPSKKAEIDRITDIRMKEVWGDILNDGTIEDFALDAVYNDERVNFLRTELKVLNKRAGNAGKPAPTPFLKQTAKDHIEQQPIRTAFTPGRFQAAEVRAAREAQLAVIEGDYQRAAEAKQRQILNHELVRASRNGKNESEKMLNYFKKFDRSGIRSKLDVDHLDQIDALLARFDLRKAVSLRAIDKRKALADWITEQEGNGSEVVIPDRLRSDAFQKHYKDMSLEELRGLHDAVKNIEHLGRLKNKLLAAKEKRDFDEVVNGLAESIYENNDLKPVSENISPDMKEKVKESAKGFHAEHTKMEFFFRKLDGDQDLGPVWNAIFKPLADAETAEQAYMERIIPELNKALNRYSRVERMKWHFQKTYIEEVGKSFTKAELLSVGLNWGNVDNRDAIKKGFGWSDAEAEAVVSKLDKRDWDTIQDIWDLIHTLWPDVEAMQKELAGVAPEKVKSLKVTTEYGEYRGGYYPLRYDERKSFLAHLRDEKRTTQDLYESSFLRPMTRNGHIKERVGSGGQPVKLDLVVMTEHLQNVVHDLTHRKAILDADRIVMDQRIREAIEDTAGTEMYRQIRPWVQAIANEKPEPSTKISKILSKARIGATVVGMGWKVTTAIVQPLGYLQSVDQLGVKHGWKGLKKFFGDGNPLKMKEQIGFVMDRSTMMRNRQKTFDRDVRDTLKKMTIKGPLYEVEQSYFYLTGLMDMGVSVPTWLGAYDQGMEKFDGDEAKAIDHADSMVRRTQGAGGVKDLAAIQRHHELMRLYTTFYSYFNVLYNLGSERIRQFRDKDINVAQLTASAFFLWFAPAVLSEIIAGRGPDDEDEWDKWALNKIGAYPFQSMVLVRDIANGVLGDYGYNAAPAFEAIERTSGALKAVGEAALTDEEWSRGDTKNAFLAASYWAPLPGRQMWISGEYTFDLMTGEESEFSLRDLMFYRNK
ncbi:hypothetical protein [Terasakiella pusilla]|uniref:MuF-C-terminal domain-containing protein n=1 Tax=Terasakiella pusilla TaxID=64973 RepID=UPI003AA801C1